MLFLVLLILRVKSLFFSDSTRIILIKFACLVANFNCFSNRVSLRLPLKAGAVLGLFSLRLALCVDDCDDTDSVDEYCESKVFDRDRVRDEGWALIGLARPTCTYFETGFRLLSSLLGILDLSGLLTSGCRIAHRDTLLPFFIRGS